ncbi:lytic murein transglycosylase [Pseudorhodoplanes sp.]|uniref:lytic murein transglycosylase n=1 Tax=Pseudorhodoplanes sp. TaxID=1934341 RepID=UPI003D12D114
MACRRGTLWSLWPVAALGLALIGCAGAGEERKIGVTTTASVPQAARAVQTSGARRSFAQATGPEWSGESGASGHPLMSADAIRAAAGEFQNCLQGLYPAASKRGIPKQAFDTLTRDLTPDLKIMDLVDAQPEFTLAFWDYLDRLVGEERIQRGRELLQQHRATFDAMEARYNVDRYVIAAIWGIESKYSTMMGERAVLRSTATLACVGRRQNYFRNEFLAALEILYRGDVQPDRMKGSWAGAFGPTQFMPTVYMNYALDADGDGRRDMTASVPDLLFSTANYFRKHGWVSGQTWGYEVVVPNNFNFMLADRNRLMTIREWEQLGIRRAGDKPFPRGSDRAFLLVPAGSQGPGFLMLNNFRVIMRYNPAEAYALAIGHLSDRLRGGEPLVQAWPRHERVLTRDERTEMQQLLARRGFDVGEADGRFGSKTRAAIRDFQARAGLVPDGFPSVTVLARLRGN